MSTPDSGHNPSRRQALGRLAAWTGAAVVRWQQLTDRTRLTSLGKER